MFWNIDDDNFDEIYEYSISFLISHSKVLINYKTEYSTES